MKKLLIGFIFSILLVLGIWLALTKPVKPNHNDVSKNSVSTQRARLPHTSRHAGVLDRVRAIAQQRLPKVEFIQREDLVFSQLDPKIDELEVMELLLAVETEFDLDIPEERINERLGSANRRDLVNHLSLSLVAELVDGVEFPEAP